MKLIEKYIRLKNLSPISFKQQCVRHRRQTSLLKGFRFQIIFINFILTKIYKIKPSTTLHSIYFSSEKTEP